MTISAKEVNELRKQTGAGMMDCKKALVEAEGDFQKAVDLLRKKGQKVSASRADRAATEGSVFAYGNDKQTEVAMIQLNCETDFVARNEDFQNLGNSIVKTAYENKPADLDALKAMEMNGRSVQDHLTDAMGKIGEKLDVSSYALLDGESVVTYIHPGARVGVLVAFEGSGDGDVNAIGKDVAMQIAAMNPVALDKDGVSSELIEKEMEIGREQAREQGKPEDLVEKIAAGKLNKYYKENTLLNQDFVKDTSKTVAQYIKEHGPDLKVKSFKRIQLGSN